MGTTMGRAFDYPSLSPFPWDAMYQSAQRIFAAFSVNFC